MMTRTGNLWIGLLAGAAWATLSAGVGAETVVTSLTAGPDTYVREFAGAAEEHYAFGDNSKLLVWGGSDVNERSQILVRFELPNDIDTVNSALLVLTLQTDNMSGTEQTISVGRMNQDWEEGVEGYWGGANFVRNTAGSGSPPWNGGGPGALAAQTLL